MPPWGRRTGSWVASQLPQVGSYVEKQFLQAHQVLITEGVIAKNLKFTVNLASKTVKALWEDSIAP